MNHHFMWCSLLFGQCGRTGSGVWGSSDDGAAIGDGVLLLLLLLRVMALDISGAVGGRADSGAGGVGMEVVALVVVVMVCNL